MRPDRAAGLPVRILAHVHRGWTLAVAVEHLGGDRRIGGVEVVGRLHADIFLGRKIDPRRGEDFGAERLRAMRDQRYVDAADADAGSVAEFHFGLAKTLHAVLREAKDGDLAVDRL